MRNPFPIPLAILFYPRYEPKSVVVYIIFCLLLCFSIVYYIVLLFFVLSLCVFFILSLFWQFCLCLSFCKICLPLFGVLTLGVGLIGLKSI